ncbi:MAG TPA: glycoside hydrolase family 15 protein [Micromonosporaceae bacterium]|jgi:GH15 family glucan-1,4-alpha-glucosidase|nr:glycoside hydrolase family 15 protein [Micromonosporaceae bacterium]
MFDPDPPFRPIRTRDGYLPLEDLGLIGDGETAALVGLDGSIPWMCLPRFDSEPVFCGLLDHAIGGHFTIAPTDPVTARQRYEPDTAVLITEIQSATGLVRLTDAFALCPGADLTDDSSADRAELIRSATVLDGHVELVVDVQPRGGGSTRAAAGGMQILVSRRPELTVHLRSSRPLDGLRTVHTLGAGDRLDVVLSWSSPHRHHRFNTDEMLGATADAWRRWMTGFEYDGFEQPLVRRAAITLKLCDHWQHGSLVAAPSSSLPAPIGGVRNWDYRYSWVRDAAYSVYALRRIGFRGEANAYLGWVLDAFEHGPPPRIMYAVDGAQVPDEWQDTELEGYRRSAPARWGNGAADQRQHDLYGEVIDCAYQWVGGGGTIEGHLWRGLAALADSAAHAWHDPDQGIWEVRSEGRAFTYSAGMCHVALDRAVRIAERLALPGDTAAWRAAAERIRHAVVEEAWNEDAHTISEHLDGDGLLDASLLALPLRRVIPADHPRMVATANAVADRLSAGGGLLYRYHHKESPDGIVGDEGAFLLCSFWLVENLARQQRLDAAAELYESLCARASSLGLFPEQIDPATGEFIGNFPQAFSHIGVISSGVNLTSLTR